MLDQIAAIPAPASTSNGFMQEVDAFKRIEKVTSPGEAVKTDNAAMSDEAAFRKVFEYFFAGIIDKALNPGRGGDIDGGDLANEYMSKLYSQEIAEALISEVNFKNLIASRSFKE